MLMKKQQEIQKDLQCLCRFIRKLQVAEMSIREIEDMYEGSMTAVRRESRSNRDVSGGSGTASKINSDSRLVWHRDG